MENSGCYGFGWICKKEQREEMVRVGAVRVQESIDIVFYTEIEKDIEKCGNVRVDSFALQCEQCLEIGNYYC